MKGESVEYFRARARTERDAALNASCDAAREAHEQMASTYARMVELEDLKALGAIPPGKVISIADALRERDDAEFGHRAAPAPGLRAQQR